MDDFDPEQIQRDLDRLRQRRSEPPPTDAELRWWARYQVAAQKIQELQAEMLHPSTTADRVQEISGQLPALRKQLSDLEASGLTQDPRPPSD